MGANSLIYLVAFGREYAEVANICISSLKLFGGWKGDISVFTDTPYAFNGEMVDVRLASAGEEYQIARVNLALVADLSCYDTITYLDCDHLAFSDINWLSGLKSLYGYQWNSPVPARQAADANAFVPEDDLDKPFGRWCSGFISGPAKEFMQAMKKWKEVYYRNPLRGNPWFREQSALNTAISNGLEIEPISESRVHHSGPSDLVHYWAKRKEWMFICYEQMIAGLKPAAMTQRR